MNIDLSAQEHIVELEAQLEDCHVIIDLQRETINELTESVNELTESGRNKDKQIWSLMNGQKVDYGVA